MDNYTEPGKNDLYMMELNELPLDTSEIQKNNDLQVYPNPIDDFVSVSLPNQSVQYQYKIYNLSGSLVQQGVLDSNKINCSSLQSGLYVLNIFSQNESYSIKVLKN